MFLFQETIRISVFIFRGEQSESHALPKWNRRCRLALDIKEALIVFDSSLDSVFNQLATDSLSAHIVTHLQDSKVVP